MRSWTSNTTLTPNNRGISAVNTNLNVLTVNIDSSVAGATGITFQSDAGDGLSVMQVDIDMGSAAGTTGISVTNNSATVPVVLDGTNNIVTNVTTPTTSVDNGGGFDGSIEVNDGADILP